MSSDCFRFKQFSVYHGGCAAKVGTDGVLLGAWALDVPRDDVPCTILDVGTGSGLIALMLAQRFADAQIDAIDIDPAAVNQAEENFARSPWSNRLSCKQIAFQDLAQTGCQYDVIVSDVLDPMIRSMAGDEEFDLRTADLAALAERFLKNAGMAADKIDALRARLAGGQ